MVVVIEEGEGKRREATEAASSYLEYYDLNRFIDRDQCDGLLKELQGKLDRINS